MYSIPVNQLSHNKPTQVVSQTWTKLIRAGNMTVVYFPFYLTAIFKVLNYLCFVGLHWQNVCLQSRLLTWYFMYLTLLFFYSVFSFFQSLQIMNMWPVEGVYESRTQLKRFFWYFQKCSYSLCFWDFHVWRLIPLPCLCDN